MATTRYPRRRDVRRRITPEAVAAFRAGDVGALHDSLDLPPWHASPLHAATACPYPAGTAAARTWPKAVELRLEIEAAAVK